MVPLGPLQEDNRQSLDVKEEETVALMSGDPTSQDHFKTSWAIGPKGTAFMKYDYKIVNMHLKEFQRCTI